MKYENKNKTNNEIIVSHNTTSAKNSTFGAKRNLLTPCQSTGDSCITKLLKLTVHTIDLL